MEMVIEFENGKREVWNTKDVTLQEMMMYNRDGKSFDIIEYKDAEL